MKKLLVVLVLLLSVVGCSRPLHRWEVDKAVLLCSDKGGIDYVSVDLQIFVSEVRCGDGSSHWISSKTINGGD